MTRKVREALAPSTQPVIGRYLTLCLSLSLARSAEYVQTGPYNRTYTESQLEAGGGFILPDFNEEQVTFSNRISRSHSFPLKPFHNFSTTLQERVWNNRILMEDLLLVLKWNWTSQSHVASVKVVEVSLAAVPLHLQWCTTQIDSLKTGHENSKRIM